MLKIIFAGLLTGIMVLKAPVTTVADFEFGPRTILIYSNVSGETEVRFILRIVRFHPDIFLEWESVAQQGTIHFYQEAVQEGSGFTLSGLFDNGIDAESEEIMSKWFPINAFKKLLSEGRVEIDLNNNSTEFKLLNEGTHQLTVDGKEVTVPVIHIEDSRKDHWVFLNNPGNPLLIEYRTPYYHEFLDSLVTQGNGEYRWVRQVPPIK